MAIIYRKRLPSGDWIEVGGETLNDIWKQMKDVDNIFDLPSSECGLCKCKDISFLHSTDDDGNEYFELGCKGCRATRRYGQRKKGKTLFPRWKDPQSGEPLKKNGWRPHVPRKTDDEE